MYNVQSQNQQPQAPEKITIQLKGEVEKSVIVKPSSYIGHLYKIIPLNTTLIYSGCKLFSSLPYSFYGISNNEVIYVVQDSMLPQFYNSLRISREVKDFTDSHLVKMADYAFQRICNNSRSIYNSFTKAVLEKFAEEDELKASKSKSYPTVYPIKPTKPSCEPLPNSFNWV